MKKAIAFGIVFLFLFTATISISSERKVVARIYTENRALVPIYTENGIIWSINLKNPLLEDIKERKPGNGHGHGPPGGGGGGGGNPGDEVIEKWALCIGISDYEGNDMDLQYCDDDAIDWKNFLTDNGYNVVILTDGDATADNINSAVDTLLANEDGDDYVVFTYSGHGVKYKKYGSCIVSHDKYLMTNGWFKSKFNSADSKHIFFAFDACQIGDFKKAVSDGRVGAFASNKQYSYDVPELQNGVFTYYEMEGWNYYATFEDDSGYAVQKMGEWADQYIGLNVDPFYVDSYSGDMYP